MTDPADLAAVRSKYLQLSREIDAMPASPERGNIQHTISKLGIFLENIFGEAWREPGDHRPADRAEQHALLVYALLCTDDERREQYLVNARFHASVYALAQWLPRLMLDLSAGQPLIEALRDA